MMYECSHCKVKRATFNEADGCPICGRVGTIAPCKTSSNQLEAARDAFIRTYDSGERDNLLIAIATFLLETRK